MDSVVLLETVRTGVALITLNRPEAMNAFNNELRIQLHQIIHEVSADDKVKAVILTGAGRAFCAGGDVKEMDNVKSLIGKRDRMRHYMHQILMTMTRMEKPVITAVNGYAVGSGCNLALAGDIILASNQAAFAQSFVKVGLIPDAGGLYFLPRLAGLPKAKELMFRGHKIDAAEAERIGLVNYVYQHDELLDKAFELAEELANGPTKAIGMTKTMLNQSAGMDLTSMLDYEAVSQALISNSEDHAEGVKAFKEKRKPNFNGF